jgi:hypothetical protein
MSDAARPVEERARAVAWVVGGLGTFLIMAVLVAILIRYTRPVDLTAARAQERRQFLAEVRKADAEAVGGYAWLHRDKGFLRVPVDRGIELVLKEWQNPAAARSNLIARVEKAKELPPPPPEAVNPYE